MAQFWSTVAQAVLGLASAVIATLVAIYAPKIIDLFAKKTNTEWTAEQRQIVLSAAQTAAGNIETAIDQKRMTVTDVHQDHPIVEAQVQAVATRPPVIAAMSALDMTPKYLSHIVVGKVNTGNRAPVAVETVPSAEGPIRVTGP